MGRKYNVSEYQRLNTFQYSSGGRRGLSLGKKLLLFLLLVILLIGAYYTYKAYVAIHAPIGQNKERVYIYIDKEPSMDYLHKQMAVKLIPSYPTLLKYTERYYHLRDKLQTGRYAVEPEMTTIDFVRKLAEGRQDSVVFNISHFNTEEELTHYLAQSLLLKEDSLKQLLSDPTYLRTLGETKESVRGIFLQGRYPVLWAISPKALVETFHARYQSFWTKEREARLKELKISKQQAVALASIIEAESAKEDEYACIAGLYLNRLRRNYCLQSDPTVKYALKDFGLKRILKKHLKIKSPYNTYYSLGVPPGPIHLVKPSSIDYVLNAEEHKYIYMCAKEDFSGRHNFASSYSEHLKNARAYQRALDKRGIK